MSSQVHLMKLIIIYRLCLRLGFSPVRSFFILPLLSPSFSLGTPRGDGAPPRLAGGTSGPRNTFPTPTSRQGKRNSQRSKWRGKKKRVGSEEKTRKKDLILWTSSISELLYQAPAPAIHHTTPVEKHRAQVGVPRGGESRQPKKNGEGGPVAFWFLLLRKSWFVGWALWWLEQSGSHAVCFFLASIKHWRPLRQWSTWGNFEK